MEADGERRISLEAALASGQEEASSLRSELKRSQRLAAELEAEAASAQQQLEQQMRCVRVCGCCARSCTHSRLQVTQSARWNA